MLVVSLFTVSSWWIDSFVSYLVALLPDITLDRRQAICNTLSVVLVYCESPSLTVTKNSSPMVVDIWEPGFMPSSHVSQSTDNDDCSRLSMHKNIHWWQTRNRRTSLTDFDMWKLFFRLGKCSCYVKLKLYISNAFAAISRADSCCQLDFGDYVSEAGSPLQGSYPPGKLHFTIIISSMESTNARWN